jgi:hypothetical protein
MDNNAELLADLLTKIETRSTKWDDIESAATTELNKAVRAIVFAVHQEAARKELTSGD